MKAIIRIVFPLTMALGAAGAHAAGNVETDYPPTVQPTVTAQVPQHASSELSLIQSNEGAVQVNPAFEAASPDESVRIRAEAVEPGQFDLGYFA